MSKIELALKKAQSRQLVVRSVPQDVAPGGSQGLAQVEPQKTGLISRMAEPFALAEARLRQLKVFSTEWGDNRVANAFRELRTKVMQKSAGKNCIVMVTGISSDDGSSYVALNLAVAFALAEGKTALLLDCNLSAPAFNHIAYPDSHPGLVDFFQSADARLEELIHPTGIRRLRIIPAGAAAGQSAEYFTSVRMRQLLQNVKQRYSDRFVIVDAPALTESADSKIIAEHCDHVLLVVPYGKVHEAQAQAAVKAIGEQKLLGVVFNNEPQLARLVWKRTKEVFLSNFRIFRRARRAAGPGPTL